MIDVVGSSNPDFWYALEGKDPDTVCRSCDGDSQFFDPDPSGPDLLHKTDFMLALDPEHPEPQRGHASTCDDCNGTKS